MSKHKRLTWSPSKSGGFTLSGLKLIYPQIKLIRRTEDEPCSTEAFPTTTPLSWRAGSWKLSGPVECSFPSNLSDLEAQRAARKMIEVWISTLPEDPRIVVS